MVFRESAGFESNEDIPLHSVVDAFKEIEDYEKNRGYLRPKNFSKEKPVEFPLPPQPIPENFFLDAERRLLAEDVCKQINPILKKIGLESIVTQTDSDPKYIPVTIKLMSLFNEYINTHIQPEALDNKNVVPILLLPLQELEAEIKTLGRNKGESGSLVDRMIGLKDLLEECDRLNLSKLPTFENFLKNIRQYSKWYDERVLYENLMLRSYGFDLSIDEWKVEEEKDKIIDNPINWHEAPNSIQYFISQWESVFKVLNEIKGSDLYENILKKFQAVLELAKNDIEKKSGSQWSLTKKNNFLDFIGETKIKLQQLDFSQ